MTPKAPAAKLTPAPGSAALDHVVGQIREAIIAGAFAPGERLIEQDLAARFDVSRGPVREALRVLGYQGLVTIRPNRGAVVTTATTDDVLEVYALRSYFGDLAIRHLVASGPVEATVLRGLKRLAEKVSAPRTRSSRTRQVDADLAFQSALVEASGLRRVTARFEETAAEIRMFVEVLDMQYPEVDDLAASHVRLTAAIADGDLDAARRCWRDHIRHSVDEFLAVLPAPADGGTPPLLAEMFRTTGPKEDS